jgi:hypothetical protein
MQLPTSCSANDVEVKVAIAEAPELAKLAQYSGHTLVVLYALPQENLFAHLVEVIRSAGQQILWSEPFERQNFNGNGSKQNMKSQVTANWSEGLHRSNNHTSVLF